MELPKIPKWVTRELLNLGLTPTGKPKFRIIDGQRETVWAGGQYRTKYQLTEPVQVEVFTFRRLNMKTTKWKDYPERHSAETDTDPDLLADVQMVKTIELHEVGYPCYIAECWTSPDELNEQEWSKHRYSYEYNDLIKKYEWVDMLGEFPREGRYIWLFPIIDENGQGTAPDQRTIDEIKRRIAIVENDKRTVQQRLADEIKARELAEQKLINKYAEDFIQEAGIHLKMFREGNAISKPITKVFKGE